MPAAFREFAESGVAQAKDTYEKMKAAAEEATDVLESTYSTATKGASDYGLKVIEVARANTNAAFDFAGEIMAAKTLSEVVELDQRACAQAVRGADRAEQGTERTGAEGRHRDGRADQGRHDQGLQQGQLSRPLNKRGLGRKPVLLFRHHALDGDAQRPTHRVTAKPGSPTRAFCVDGCHRDPPVARRSLAKSGYSS